MLRRDFLRCSAASGFSLLAAGCGGGSLTGEASQSSEARKIAPTPVPTTPSVPTLAGVSIDDAERAIQATMQEYTSWAKLVRTYQVDVVVQTPDELAAAIAAAFDPAALALHTRITCAWNGIQSLGGGESARLTVGGRLLADSHYAAGGSLRIEAGSGYAPAIANTVYVSAQGVTFAGLTFARRMLAGETSSVLSAVYLTKNSTYPLEPVVSFERCQFGAPSELGLTALLANDGDSDSRDPTTWTKGLSSQGLSAFVSLSQCTFAGLRIGSALVSRNVRVDRCDYRRLSGDGIDLFGHTFETGYYCNAWISGTTFRDLVDQWEFRNNHVDAVQICTSSDIHLGYSLLLTDVIGHLAHSFGADPGLGGGTQGFFGSNAGNMDNQFVIRRCAMLTTAPSAFCYYSPAASRPSFVDQSTFMRAGRTPSGFDTDISAVQDFPIGINVASQTPAAMLSVTSTITGKVLVADGAVVDIVVSDPRAGTTANRPETVFAGRDFTRGGPAANFVTGKLAYDLPNERKRPAAFVADVWANFAPRDTGQSYGIPDPTKLVWLR